MNNNLESLRSDMLQAFHDADHEKTVACVEEILSTSAALEAIYIGGLTLLAAERIALAMNWLTAAISLTNGQLGWVIEAVNRLMTHDAYEEALHLLSVATPTYPAEIGVVYLRALCLCRLNRYTDALSVLETPWIVAKQHTPTDIVRAFTLGLLGRCEDGIALLENLYQRGDCQDEIVDQHARLLTEIGQREAAMQLLDTKAPDCSATDLHRGMLMLGFGQWPEAWRLYRNRETYTDDDTRAKSLDELRDKTVFLLFEQGLGDGIQFVRYAPLLRPHCKRLMIGVPDSLKRLTEALIGLRDIEVVGGTDEAPAHDIAVAMMDCPDLLGTTVDTIPADVPYFDVPPIDAGDNALTNKPMRVGLCWAGGFRPLNLDANAIDARRSIDFEMLDELLNVPEIEFVALQQHRTADDRLSHPLQRSFDLYDTARVIAGLDLVISVDSAMAHLAGSLDVPVWMLSRFDGCWRWFWPQPDEPYYSDTPWYPSMTIFRQLTPRSWPEVLTRVTDALREVVTLFSHADQPDVTS